MSENPDEQISAEGDRRAVMLYRICSISNDPRIEDIFRYKIWGLENGIDYLVGIYSFTFSIVNNTKVEKLVALDGSIYFSGKDDAVIDYFCELHDRLRQIWLNSKKLDKYSPGFFIRWGLKLSEVFEISWLADAMSKGFVPDNWLIRPPPRESNSEDGKTVANSALAIPGKMPYTSVGKLAINAAWKIECDTKRYASADGVMELLQKWADAGSEPATLWASKIEKRGVEWLTKAGKQKMFDIHACMKALDSWRKSRAEMEPGKNLSKLRRECSFEGNTPEIK
jgi:hypothetical protein